MRRYFKLTVDNLINFLSFKLDAEKTSHRVLRERHAKYYPLLQEIRKNLYEIIDSVYLN